MGKVASAINFAAKSGESASTDQCCRTSAETQSDGRGPYRLWLTRGKPAYALVLQNQDRSNGRFLIAGLSHW